VRNGILIGGSLTQNVLKHSLSFSEISTFIPILEIGGATKIIVDTFRDIEFYETEAGRSPIIEFIETATQRAERAKIMSVFENVEHMQVVPVSFFKKLQGREKLWEIRVQRFRFLGFYNDSRRLVLVHGFVKQSQKTPLQEIDIAVKRQSMYLTLR
jgi:phage-related protein